jgi:hypothetical protein
VAKLAAAARLHVWHLEGWQVQMLLLASSVQLWQEIQKYQSRFHHHSVRQQWRQRSSTNRC